MKDTKYPQALWSEILPGLWQGGTHDTDTTHERHTSMYKPSKEDFDTVVTLYESANPVRGGVKELRFGFYDGDMSDFNVTEDLFELVQTAHRDWKAGKRVLIRCQAGWNRSGLVMALTLIKDGYEPREAIDLIRERRVPEALSNRTFERWLLNEADLEFWRGRMAA
jgi:protein-tyrosine phosphatase